jgi:hypothetical protein
MALPPDESDDTKVIRAKMAKTRASLQRKLSMLQGIVVGTLSPVREGAKILMASQKSKSSPAKSKPGGGKSKSKPAASASRSSKSGDHKGPKRKAAGDKAAVKRKVKSMASKARETLGEVLTGAAAGAAAGALAAASEAIAPRGKQRQ